jgi:hypothetical protein
MLRFDAKERRLASMPRTTMAAASILEREDLQRAIVYSWESFRDELGMPELIFLGQEVLPHESCKDRIDILALDDESRLVVIELKRGKDRLQLLQAIAYAGMVARWGEQDLRARVSLATCPQQSDIERLLKAGAVAFGEPRVFLIAESYEPEVILGANWLNGFEVPIVAYSLHVSALDGQTFLSIEQRYPLPELKDVYIPRARNRVSPATAGSGWDEVVKDLKLPWAKHAVDVLTKIKQGDPVRRRFLSMFSNGPVGSVSINLSNQHVRVYTWDRQRCTADAIAQALGVEVTVVATWGSDQTQNSGYSLALKTRESFDRFVAYASGIQTS